MYNCAVSLFHRASMHFFNQPTLTVCEQLLGCTFHWQNYAGVITEVEAYIGENDPACHAAKGKTKRNAVMFGHAGLVYVYLIYGMYHCINIVTEKEGFPAAILIRGIKLITPYEKHLDGPGKLCRELKITREHNGIDICTSPLHAIVQPASPILKEHILTTPRIGISVGKELLWRFLLID